MARLLIISLFLVLSGLNYPPNISAQTPQQPGNPNSTQWMSHQMNQPPPGPDKGPLSKGLIDDIQDLYDSAKLEAEKKSIPKSGNK